ncbi:MAG: TIR domain-containing protein [Verrucomicrobia bacterium]|nr:TIR domain-containing protein [Verrucomicrobiota bacterium]
MSADVFISYAAKDRERVAKLVEGLQQAGVSVWIDMAGIEVAAMWSKEIVSAIRECKVLLLSISPHSTESENVVKELALASERKKPIIPIYLEPAEIPETMEYQLAGIQRVEFFEGREDLAMRAVIRALAKLGVTVADEASAAAATGASNIAAHGAGHSSGKAETKGEAAVWLKVAAAVVGLAVLGMAGTLFFGSSPAPMPPPVALGQAQTNRVTQATLDTNRVVVLPFKVIGGAQDSADLGYGLVSTLTSKLQPLQSLVVIAKESARKFKDSEQSPREIGQALGAGTIVTGEIQTSGDKIQVNIQLIDANTEALGWGSIFTKTKEEFLDLQNEIATKLASELKGGLDAAESQQLAQKATENADAQAEYQAGRREWNKRSKQGFDNAINHFERAIDLDPNYAEPYVGLADTYGLLPIYNFAEPKEAMPKAKTYAEEAIKLNPKLASAYISIAWVQHMYEYAWAGAEANYRKGIQLNPNYATGHQWFGILLYSTGKAELAFDILSKATELDPNSKIIKCELAYCSWMLNKTDLAIEAVNEALAIDPMFRYALDIKYIQLADGDLESALTLASQARKKYPNQPGYLQILFELNWRSNNREKALRYFVELLDLHKDAIQKTVVARLYLTMDEPESAYRWLKQAIDNREPLVTHIASEPIFQKFHSDSRFREMFKQIDHPLFVNKP